eukprot:TRINITY_DN889_c0_g1_i4.p8 TRINITY_DN889_c0_g1~~TRINITY_DN889_c0_g1_i4.p8  ORF type:complete len:113 (+),score=6.64 TRINITY_DN889_c0_g1_i4:409-747(+)
MWNLYGGAQRRSNDNRITLQAQLLYQVYLTMVGGQRYLSDLPLEVSLQLNASNDNRITLQAQLLYQVYLTMVGGQRYLSDLPLEVSLQLNASNEFGSSFLSFYISWFLDFYM